MSSGIRVISYKADMDIKLSDILNEIPNGNLMNWSILFMDALVSLDNGEAKHLFGDDVNESEKGLNISWKDLQKLAEQLFEDLEMLIIGGHELERLHRYKTDREMYESCDVVIEMIDTGYWELFSSDAQLIERLKKKYGIYKLLETDFDPKL